jgi:tetratricopeptide (TPR) repeat protein
MAGVAIAETAEDCYNQGTSLLKAGRTAEAVAQFQRAIELKPDLAAAHFNLGQAWEKQGSLDQAVSAYRDAIRCRNDSKYLQSLGLVLKKKKQLPEAIAAFEQATKADPSDPKAFFNLANACAESNAPAVAVTHYERALKLRYPRPADVYLNLGIAYQKQGQPAAAVQAYENYLKAAPKATNAAQIREVVAGLRSGKK